MTRLYDTVGWLLSSLGLALLVCGWVLVPQNRLLGEEETEIVLGEGCAGDECNTSCLGQERPCRGGRFACNNEGGGIRNCGTCACRERAYDHACHCLLTP